MGILENIQGHQDLIKLNSRQRTQLCQEIRTFLVDHVSKTGGHVSSNMGVVELTVALETVFDTSVDRFSRSPGGKDCGCGSSEEVKCVRVPARTIRVLVG